MNSHTASSFASTGYPPPGPYGYQHPPPPGPPGQNKQPVILGANGVPQFHSNDFTPPEPHLSHDNAASSNFEEENPTLNDGLDALE